MDSNDKRGGISWIVEFACDTSGEDPSGSGRCRGHAYQTTGSKLWSACQPVVSSDRPRDLSRI